MATIIKPELSQKNKYYVEKHRYYELKHFCLQYNVWKKKYMNLDGYTEKNMEYIESNTISDITARHAEKRIIYFNKMQIVEQAALDADGDLASYILKGVTEDLSYNTLHTKYNIPCGKNTYYDRYRRFFWLLDKSRN